ncbi:hypothetical protein GC169_08195 [bacterium]|nr:hypothetical protein [bacterium]
MPPLFPPAHAALLAVLVLAACGPTGGGASRSSSGEASDAAAASCDLAASILPEAGEGCGRAWIDANLRLNDIQVLGTHNSYKDWIAPEEFAIFMDVAPAAARTLDYAHEPIPAQLDWGIRQFEIDILNDPDGGRFLDPLLRRRAIAEGRVTPELAFREEMSRPGFKVLHVPDLDYRTTCPTFVACLRHIRDWSVRHPDHTPILIMLNPKVTPASWEGATPVLPLDGPALDRMDAEILSVFPPKALIRPADVKGDHSTLREAVLAGGWPTLGEARGKVLFASINGPDFYEPYRAGPGGLAARVAFIRVAQDDPDAAFVMWDDPIANQEAIRKAVADGFIVRTRTEQDTVEPRVGDTAKREAAFASSAQFVSTDYYKPNPAFGDFSVAMPGGAIARCNPQRTAERCGGVAVE